jgi:ubiquinol-cytochrome c reductase subunit 8
MSTSDQFVPGLPAQKGVVSYQIAPNRVSQETILYNKGGVFNMIRRSRNQFLYVVPPFVAAYFLMSWAEER